MGGTRPLKKGGAGIPRQFLSTELINSGGLDIEGLGTHEIKRDGDDLTFKDVNNPTPCTLTQLKEGAGGPDILASVDHILNTEAFTVPIRRQMHIKGSLILEGSLTLKGTLLLF